MGFPGFQAVSAGIFSILIFNTVLSIAAAFNHISTSLLLILGIQPHRPHPSLPEPDAYITSALTLLSICAEIRSSLLSVTYDPAVHGSSGNSQGRGGNPPDAHCAVCLSEFECGACIVQLPRCGHVFHRQCVDRCLDHQQTTCPLCRAPLVSEEMARQSRRREQELAEELLALVSCHGHHGSLWHWW